MKVQEEIQLGNDLRQMVQESRGYQRLLDHINQEIKEGWESFIKLPAEKKTSKTSFEHQAAYKVLKNLKDWIDEAIRVGEQVERLERRKEAITQ